VVPLATPLPPAEFIHATCTTPRLSAAVPDRLIVDCVVEYVDPVVGVLMDTVGRVVSIVVPPLLVDDVAPIAHCFVIPGAGSPNTPLVHAVPPVKVL